MVKRCFRIRCSTDGQPLPPLTRKAIEIANSRNVPVVVDAETPFDADVVRHATHVAFSFQGIRNFTGLEEAGSALVAASEKLGTWVSFTDGKNGTYFLENGVPVNIPAVAVEVVDTLGAGDVWHAAFTLTLAEGQAPRRAIIFANAAATVKCTRSGGRMDWPTRAEVERFLDLHKLAI